MGKNPGIRADRGKTNRFFENFVTNIDSSNRIAYIRRECVSTHKGRVLTVVKTHVIIRKLREKLDDISSVA
jgi:hypothetical protein